MIDFLAKIKYISTEAGGRKTAAHSGYRPHIKFDFSNYLTSGQQTFLDKKEVKPGEDVDVEIQILSVEHFAKSLEEGMEFDVCEGTRIVGRGKIIEVINENLRK